MSCKSIACVHTKDRISDFPDAIILHILSFADAKTAVRTGILSKRFAYLWTEAPCLSFEQATDFVYTTIYFHKRLNLEKVSVKTRYNLDDLFRKDEFRRSICLLSLAGVKELVFELIGSLHPLPQQFYLSPSLQKLTMKSCCISEFVNWKSLQNLSLSSMSMFQDTISKVLLGCPSLEILKLSSIRLSPKLNLTDIHRISLANNKCLRKLVIDSYQEKVTLEIFAPNLQSFVLSGFTKWFRCRVLDANSLTDCILDFYESANYPDNYRMLTTLLDGLSHVEVVTLGEWVLHILSLVEQRIKLPCPMSKAIKCLKIRTNLRKDDMVGVECLLRNLNRLETLSIEFGDYAVEYNLIQNLRKARQCESYRKSKKMETEVDLKLKNVKVCYLETITTFQYAMDQVLLLAKFVLKNGKLMENISISARGSDCYLLKLANSLLEFPRSSPNVTIKVQDW